ncbi:4-aminobutyrate--2-oxoglutarate transaminase [Rouxiella sp. Mn2063]|uniref:4-aminobutyrate--2-oxoglutarate transaminase n=1 Tax=Rouxiella sp. Mn2063 TaxID=3395262 RepID=UPI003BCC111F
MEDKNAALGMRKQQATPRGIGVMCDWFAEHADNATLWDVEGREFIDFAGGIAVLNTGHRHKKVIAAIARQLDKFTHTAYQIVPYESYVHLAERINDRVPIPGAVKTAFFSTGAEALENAVKIARASTGRHGIITFGGAFHGRTYMTMAMTGKTSPYKNKFGPMPASVFHARYPNTLHGVSVDDAMQSLEAVFAQDIAAQDVAAIVLEPIQGEGGFNIAPADFMQRLRECCDQHKILLIADEVQCGFARTGKLFAMEHYAAKADLITMAKSLAAGLPLSAVAGRAQIMDAPEPGGLGGTYAGNPLAIAAAHAVLDIIDEEQLCQRAIKLGDKLADTLRQSSKNQPAIAEIRARGSMIAVEFCDPNTKRPDACMTRDVQQYAMKHGLLLLICGQHSNVIRFLYPLTIPDDQFQRALNILQQAIEAHTAA